jgi:hypothetical protein
MSVTRTKCFSVSGTGSAVNGGKSEFEFDARRHAHISSKMSERLRSRFALHILILRLRLSCFSAAEARG